MSVPWHLQPCAECSHPRGSHTFGLCYGGDGHDEAQCPCKVFVVPISSPVDLEIRFYDVDKSAPKVTRSKVADVELWFNSGPMAGLKLMGLSIRSDGRGGFRVEMPTRKYTVGLLHRRFDFMRPQNSDDDAVGRFTDYVLAAWQLRKERAER